MAETAGYVGEVAVQGVAALNGIREWSLDWNADPLETTDFNSTSDYREFIAGLKGWSGSFGGFHLAGTGAYPAVGTTEIMEFNLDATNYYLGTVLITSVTPGVTVDGVNVITYNFTGSGYLIFTNDT